MAKTKISEFSTTAGNNTDINSINIAEGCAPSGINDAIRELMRQLKEFQTGGAGDSVNSGGDFSVATNKFTVASASGNTAVAGTLGVTGAATLSSTLAVTGTTTLTGALVANGNATLGDGSGDTVTVKGTPTLEVNPTLSGGTANGVLYLNGSKVATAGSALTFNGTSLGVGSSSYGDAGTITASIGVAGTTAGGLQLWASSAQEHYIQWGDSTSGSGTYAGAISYSHASDFMRFWVNSSEAMRLTSTGLGIGTSSPSYPLHVVRDPSSGAVAAFRGTSTAANSRTIIAGNSSGDLVAAADTSGNSVIYSDSSKTLAFGTNGSATAQILLNTSGNLGLGVTPSAWASSFKALQIGAGLSLYDNGIGSGTFLGANYYYNGTNNIYKNTAAATAYSQSSGVHAWYTAASGTAGDAITFTQAATLTADGDYLVGQTSAGLTDAKSVTLSKQYGVVYVNHLTGQTSGDQYAIFGYAGGSIGSITQSGTTAVSYNTTSDQRLKENIADAASSSELIDALQVRQFDWKADGSHQRYGFVAQELVTVAPEAVHQPADPEEMMAVDYSKLVPMLVKEIQSLRKRLADAGIA